MVDIIVKKDVLVEKLSSVLKLIYDKCGQHHPSYTSILHLLQVTQCADPKDINFNEAFELAKNIETSVERLPDSVETKAKKITARLISSDPELKKKCLTDSSFFQKIEKNIVNELSQ